MSSPASHPTTLTPPGPLLVAWPQAAAIAPFTRVFAASSRRDALVAAYPELDAACDRLGFGDAMTLQEWCPAPVWALLELARAAEPPPPAPTVDWALAMLGELVVDIITAHHRPLLNELDRVGILVDHFCRRRPDLRHLALAEACADVTRIAIAHLAQEEESVFPLALACERASRLAAQPTCAPGSLTTALRTMRIGQQDLDDARHRLRALVRTAAAGSDDPDLTLIATALAAMREDLLVHEVKENDILVPAAIWAEELARSHAQRPRTGTETGTDRT